MLPSHTRPLLSSGILTEHGPLFLQAGLLHGLSPASSLTLSEAQSPSAGSPASAHLLHMAARHAPARAASHLGRPLESGAPISASRLDPQACPGGWCPVVLVAASCVSTADF